jgi:hypothetical protein
VKQPSHWSLTAALVVAIGATMVSPGHAEASPIVENSAPGISRPAPERPTPNLDPGTPSLWSNKSGGLDQIGPSGEARQESLADCMAFWDAGTHMSKREWQLTCQRTLNGRYF